MQCVHYCCDMVAASSVETLDDQPYFALTIQSFHAQLLSYSSQYAVAVIQSAV